MTPELLSRLWRVHVAHRELALGDAVPKCLGYADADSDADGSTLCFFYEYVDARPASWLLARGAEKAEVRAAELALAAGCCEDEDGVEREVGGRQRANAAVFREACVLRESDTVFRRWAADLLHALKELQQQSTHRLDGRLTLGAAMLSSRGCRLTLGRLPWGPAVTPADADAARRTVVVGKSLLSRGTSTTLPSYFELREWQLLSDYGDMVRAHAARRLGVACSLRPRSHCALPRQLTLPPPLRAALSLQNSSAPCSHRSACRNRSGS